jgi:hypothetical protein
MNCRPVEPLPIPSLEMVFEVTVNGRVQHTSDSEC